MIVDTHIESWRTRPLMLVGWTFKTHFHRKFAGDVRLLMPFLPRCGVCWHPAGPVPGEPPEFGGEFRRTLYGK